MGAGEFNTERLHEWLARMRQRDAAAPNELLLAACGRLEALARKMLRSDPVHRWEQTGDLLQNAVLRLLRALETVTPDSTQGFFALAGRVMRRELIDLGRHHHGPEGAGARHASDAGLAHEHGSNSLDPEKLAEWTEVHRQVEALPEKEKEVFNLLYYQDKKQREAAALLEVDESTVQRRWLSALRKLRHTLHGKVPDL